MTLPTAPTIRHVPEFGMKNGQRGLFRASTILPGIFHYWKLSVPSRYGPYWNESGLQALCNWVDDFLLPWSRKRGGVDLEDDWNSSDHVWYHDSAAELVGVMYGSLLTNLLCWWSLYRIASPDPTLHVLGFRLHLHFQCVSMPFTFIYIWTLYSFGLLFISESVLIT